MSLINVAINRSRTIIFTLVFLLFAGISTYISIPKESAPDVKIPIIYVSLHHKGISPEDAERLVIRPIEQKVRSIEGIKEMRSTAREDGGSVTLEFSAGFDSKKAISDVREKVDEAKADLPEETDEPVVKEVSFSQFPVLVVHLAGNIPKRALYKTARELRDAIEGNVSSVLEAKIAGDQEESVEIVVDPAKLERYSINLQEAVSLFQRNNSLISAGTLDNGKGRFAIKVKSLMTNISDILSAPLAQVNGRVLRFSDVAEIRKTYRDPTGFARLKGEQAVALEISKRAGENIIDTIEKVKAVVTRAQEYFPPTLSVSYSQDESGRIRDMLSDLENNVIAAVLLVMGIIVISLGWRSSFLVGVAVPGSFLIGIVVIALMGNTVNIVVLFSLILSIGMLVDGAIIVAEFADRRMKEGVHPRDAFAQAAQRMTWPVITSIITIIAAFLPLLFWPGIVGQFMRFLPLTLIATLTASIVMALIFLPTLGTAISKRAKERSAKKPPPPAYINLYEKILRTVLARPGKTLVGVFVSVIAVVFLYGFLGKGTQFFPSIEPDTAAVHVRARGNLSVWEKDALVRKVEERLLDMEEFLNVYTSTDVGGRSRRGGGNPPPEDTIGTITIEFVNWAKRRPASFILKDVLERTNDIPGVIVQLTEDKPGPPTGKPIHLEISSIDPTKLLPVLRKIRTYLETVDGLEFIEDTSPIPGLEWVVDINREKAALFGATASEVGQGIRFISNGFKLHTYRPDDSRDEVDILVRFPKKYRNLKQLENLYIQTSHGAVPISSFTTQKFQPRLDTIKRVNGQRVYTITAETKKGVFGPVKVAEVAQWLKENHQDTSVQVRFKGEDEDKKETSSFLGKAFLITLFMITLILVTQFNSFFSAGLVLSAIFLSTVGVLVGLMITGRPFNIVMGGIGVIALGGIIVSNNILMIETFDLLKKKTNSVFEAILQTGLERVRAVLLTQITTALGLVPMMLKLNINFFDAKITYNAPSSQWWVDLSTAIVFGVTFATVLTLVVTPCALMLKENLRVSLEKESILKRTKRLLKI